MKRSCRALDTKPLVGHLAAWNYFMSDKAPANKAFIDQWHAYIKKPKRTTNDPMEAHYIGFNLWVKAVEKAKSTDVDKVLAALPGLEVPNLTGGMAKMLPNHHITKPVFIGEVRADGQFNTVWKTTGLVPGDAWSDYLPGQQGHRRRLGDAQVRELQHQDQDVLRTELQVTARRFGSIAVASPMPRRSSGYVTRRVQPGAGAVRLARPLAGADARTRRCSFGARRAARGQLPGQGGDRRPPRRGRPPEPRQVLTALLEDRSVRPQRDQKIFIVQVGRRQPHLARR